MKSIRTKITLLLIICVMISSLVIGVLGMSSVTDTLHENAEENMKLICDVNTKELNKLFKSAILSANILSITFSEMLPDASLLSDEELCDSYIEQIRREAYKVFDDTLDISGLYFYLNTDPKWEEKGFFWGKYSGESEAVLHDLSFIYHMDGSKIARKSLMETVKNGKTAKWLPSTFNPKLGMYLNCYAVPVYKSDVCVGVLGLCISGNDIKRIIGENKVYDNGFVAVLDDEGKVLYHPEHNHGDTLNSVSQGSILVSDIVAANEKSERLISYTSHGQKRRMTFSTLITGMRLCVVAPESEIFAKQNRLTQRVIVLLIIIMILTFVFAYVFANKLTNPILKLNHAANEMTKGNLDIDILAESKDEVGELARNLNEARTQLKEHMDTLYSIAHMDGLTGVNNKIAFDEMESKLNKAIEDSKNLKLFVAIFDVNNLKVTNDILGHLAGDELLVTVAEHICKYTDRKNVYRIGGDEFAVILSGSDTFYGIRRIEKAAVTIGELSLKSYPDIKVSCAYGFSEYNPLKDKSLVHILAKADRQMYLNKAKMNENQDKSASHKGLKQLQTEKYLEFLHILSQSTEDYLFLYSIESDVNWLFGNLKGNLLTTNSKSSISNLDEFILGIYPADRDSFKERMSLILKGKTSEIDINLRINSKESSLVWFNLRGKVINDGFGQPFMVIGRLSENELRNLYNPLTGLFNKNKFSKDLQNKTLPDFSHMMLVNIDALAAVNIKHGRKHGDELLCKLARELDDMFGHGKVYHMERDNFMVLLNVKDDSEIREYFENINSKLDEMFTVSAVVVPNDKTIYLDRYDEYEYATQLISANKGQSVLSVFSDDDYRKNVKAVELFEELEESVRKSCEGFYLCYQPKVKATDYSLFGAEALLRYKSKERGDVYPDEFIPVLERTGLINEVGLWVFEHAVCQCAKWREIIADFRMAINFSCVQLRRDGIAEKMLSILQKYKVPGEAITIEITESVQLEDTDSFVGIFDKLQHYGIIVSIDDFGTGYANMGYLKKIHANEIKIDRSFIQDIKDTSYNYRLVKNIIEFAKTNSFFVCLEGVENIEELSVIGTLDADTLQGYFFDKPLLAKTFEDSYLDHKCDKFLEAKEKIKKIRDSK